MKRHSVFVFVLILFSVVVCGEVFAAPTPRQKMRIGVVIPLTGGLAEYGTAARNGILLAQQEFKDQLHDIEFIFEDSRYDTTATVTACKKLQTVDNVRLQYVWGYGPAAACAAIADANKMPILAVSSDPDVEKNRPYVVRFATSIERHSTVLTRYLADLPFKRIAIVAAEIPFISGIIEGMKSRLSPTQSIVLVDKVQPGDMDFKSITAQIRNQNIDVVGVFLLSGQVSQFYKTAIGSGLRVPTFGTDFFDSETEVTASLPGIIGAVFPAPDVSEVFKNKYLSVYRSSAHLPYAANAFDFVELIAKFFGSEGSDLAVNVMLNNFRSVGVTSGASGTFQYREKGEFSPGYDFNVVLKKVDSDGKVVLVERRPGD